MSTLTAIEIESVEAQKLSLRITKIHPNGALDLSPSNAGEVGLGLLSDLLDRNDLRKSSMRKHILAAVQEAGLEVEIARGDPLFDAVYPFLCEIEDILLSEVEIGPISCADAWEQASPPSRGQMPERLLHLHFRPEFPVTLRVGLASETSLDTAFPGWYC